MSRITLSSNPAGVGTLTVAAPNTNTNRTITLPDVTTTLVGTDASQTLSNKAFTGTTTAPIIVSGTSATDLALSAGTVFNTNGASIALRGSTSGYNTTGMEFYTGLSERMRIDSSGNVGIGTTSTYGFKMFVLGGANSGVAVSDNTNTVYMMGDGGTTVTVGTPNSVPLSFKTAATERLRIGPGGQLGIGGANYGTSGQVLTSGGSGAAPSWATAGPGFASSVVTLKNRATGTTFQNTTTGWLFVAFAGTNNGTSAYVGASPGAWVTVNSANATYTGGSFMVPPSWYYYINYSGLSFWSEGQA